MIKKRKKSWKMSWN